MGLNLSIQYRGDLSGCNYDCHYCPFAKRVDSKELLSKDAEDLERFVDWIKGQPTGTFKILFTPWGEALIRTAYKNALCQLSQLPQVHRVAIQTNLSCKLKWIEGLDKEAASLWCTYHPGEVSVSRFLQKCTILDTAHVRYSVGTVGIKSSFDHIQVLRNALPSHIYTWINAYKDEGPEYYSDEDIAFLTNIDPYFSTNLYDYQTLGRTCRAGESAITVDGDGNVRRCHFIPEIIGNLFEDKLEASLRQRICSRNICDCHIGYVNIPDLDLDPVFDGWALGRVANIVN